MGNLVFQATLGGQVNLVGPNTASTFNLNVPAVSSTLATLAAQTFAGTQTMTTLTSPAATNFTLQSAGTTAVTIDTSQRVGINTTSPTQNLSIGGSTGTYGQNLLYTGSGGPYTVAEYSITPSTGEIRLGGTNTTGTYFQTFYTQNSERMRIDSSGNVGIGTSTINGRLNISGAPGSTSFQLNAGGTLSGARRNWGISAEKYAAGALTIEVGASEGANPSTAVATFDSSGNLLVGNSSAGGTGWSLYPSGYSITNGATSTFTHMSFQTSSSQKGYIQTVGGTTNYNGSSDYRLKENVIPLPNALQTVAQLKPVKFNWKEDNAVGYSFIAHELQEVVPQAVGGTKDEVDENGKPVYQGVDPSKLVCFLTAAIQELKAINDTQAETINALTARIVALETK